MKVISLKYVTESFHHVGFSLKYGASSIPELKILEISPFPNPRKEERSILR